MKNLNVLLALLLFAAAPVTPAEWQQTGGPDGGRCWDMCSDGTDLLVLIENTIYRLDGDTWQPEGSIAGAWGIEVWNASYFAMQRAVGGYQLLRSEDRGRTWIETRFNADNPLEDLGNLNVTAEMMYLAHKDTLFTSADGGKNWAAHPVCASEHPTSLINAVSNGEYVLSQRAFSMELCRFSDLSGPPESVAVPPGFGMLDILWAHGADFMLSNRSFGVYRSSDGGETWLEATEGLEKNSGNAWPSFREPVFDGTYTWTQDEHGRSFRFDGERWEMIGSSRAIVTQQVYKGTVYAATYDGVFAYQRDVAGWRSANTGLSRQKVSMLKDYNGVLFANSMSSTYRSTDRGASWNVVASASAEQIVNGSDGLLFARMGIGSATAVVFKSTDEGLSWQAVTNEFDAPLMDLSAIASDGENLYVAFEGYFTIHGRGETRWGFGGLRRSSDDGKTWVDISRGLPEEGYVPAPTRHIIAEPGLLLAATVGGFFRSTNAGASWLPASAGLPNVGRNAGVFAAGNRLFAYEQLEGRVFESTDRGASWQALGSPFGEGTYIHTLSYAKARLYAHIHNGIEFRTFRFHEGAWQDIAAELPEGVAFQTVIQSGSELFAGSFSHGVWRQGTSVTDVEDETTTERVRVFPNPVSSELNFEITATENAPVHIQICDLRGALVRQWEGVPAESGRVRLPLPHLTAGVYYYTIRCAGNTYSGSVVHRP